MTIEQRRAMKAVMAKTVLAEKHTVNCRVLPDRLSLLSHLPKQGIAAEIGAAFGDFTAEILTRNNPRILHLVDAWDSERYQNGLAKIWAEHSADIESGRIVIGQGYSTSVLPRFDPNTFDWVYIDTDHTYETTLSELTICRDKVKDGGFIAGHDFCTGNVITPWPYGVIEACLKFCIDHNWEFRYLTIEYHGHHSFALAKIA